MDVTNQTTKDWWVQRLRNLLESSGMDGFKFDGGKNIIIIKSNNWGDVMHEHIIVIEFSCISWAQEQAVFAFMQQEKVSTKKVRNSHPNWKYLITIFNIH